MLIMTKTPLRVSFVGGGTDIDTYYKKNGGAVISTTIQRYIYILVNKRFEASIRVSYSKTEIVDSVDKIEHNIVRESMKKTGLEKGIEIVSIADIPSRGTGLGSSSAFTVGLLNGLYAYTERHSSAKSLAEDACDLEINILNEPIGKQDQYAAAYGGFNIIKFHTDESVSVNPILISQNSKKELEKNIFLIYTGLTRNASSILLDYKKKYDEKKENSLNQLKELTFEFYDFLSQNDITQFGETLHKGWLLKKQMSTEVSNFHIDNMYKTAMNAGALGGKILGAGGGGFLLIYVPEEKHNNIRETFKNHKIFNLQMDRNGSKIIHVGDEYG